MSGVGEQLTRRLAPGKRAAQLVRNLRPRLEHRRQILLGQLVGGDRYESLERRLRGLSGQQPDLAEMIARADAQQLDLALGHELRERQHPGADDEQ